MKKVFIFVLGAAAGSVVTWVLVKEKYKRIADEEIESVVEHYKNKEENCETADIQGVVELSNSDVKIEEAVKDYTKEDESVFTDKEKKEYGEKIKDLGYTNETEQNKDYIKPYVIAPEEFGEFGNKTVSLMYFSDFVLATDDGEIISDPESIIGDGIKHFGEYEDDCVHVRNENNECDYEILLSEKTFSEVYGDEN